MCVCGGRAYSNCLVTSSTNKGYINCYFLTIVKMLSKHIRIFHFLHQVLETNADEQFLQALETRSRIGKLKLLKTKSEDLRSCLKGTLSPIFSITLKS